MKRKICKSLWLSSKLCCGETEYAKQFYSHCWSSRRNPLNRLGTGLLSKSSKSLSCFRKLMSLPTRYRGIFMIILYGRVDIGTLVETAKKGIRSLKLVGVKRLFHNSFLSYFSFFTTLSTLFSIRAFIPMFSGRHPSDVQPVLLRPRACAQAPPRPPRMS